MLEKSRTSTFICRTVFLKVVGRLEEADRLMCVTTSSVACKQ